MEAVSRCNLPGDRNCAGIDGSFEVSEGDDRMAVERPIAHWYFWYG
jgi:hypothetical protein